MKCITLQQRSSQGGGRIDVLLLLFILSKMSIMPQIRKLLNLRHLGGSVN